jgi:hypothetical protein
MPGYLLEGTRLPFETNREDNFIKSTPYKAIKKCGCQPQVNGIAVRDVITTAHSNYDQLLFLYMSSSLHNFTAFPRIRYLANIERTKKSYFLPCKMPEESFIDSCHKGSDSPFSAMGSTCV